MPELIKYTKFKLLKFDDRSNEQFSQIQHRLTHLYKICNTKLANNKFFKYKPSIKPSVIYVGYNNEDIQCFIVLTHTDDMLKNGKKHFSSEVELYTDFMNSGGVYGKRGMLISELCGNIKQYSGVALNLLKQLIKYLKKKNKIDYLFLHIAPNKFSMINLYKKAGFNIIGMYEENNKKYYIMRTFI